MVDTAVLGPPENHNLVCATESSLHILVPSPSLGLTRGATYAMDGGTGEADALRASPCGGWLAVSHKSSVVGLWRWDGEDFPLYASVALPQVGPERWATTLTWLQGVGQPTEPKAAKGGNRMRWLRPE